MNKKTEVKLDTPQDSEDNDEPLPIEPLKAQEPLTQKVDLDWITPYVQYITQGTQWEDDLPEVEKKLIDYSRKENSWGGHSFFN